MRLNTTVTAFYGKVGDVSYPAVLVTQSGADLSVWSWLDAQGTLIFFDLLHPKKNRVFAGVTGGHTTYHAANKEFHSRVELRVGRKNKSETLISSKTWHDFERTVPLDSLPLGFQAAPIRPKTPPADFPEHTPLTHATRKIVLCSGDFGNAAAVNLVFCLANSDRIVDLKKQWSHYWILEGASTIVVGAEPIPNPRHATLGLRA